ncbi:hypothetical protein PR048_020320 [Dryococelus australis]|uniref:UPF3 domain-containing protein n=1 Tax=Dryococelus australis TaxID=614101 RepID=A0ABQ9H607_9NEOP|nr:hypothetical protein PR048_020320 [Dryococelus australis]
MTQGTPSKDTENVMKKNEHLDHDKIKEKKERVKPPTKVVIRRLPPSLIQETFLKEVTPLPEYDYFYFIQGDKSLGQFAFSRAYINFIHQEDVFRFKERFDNYAFLDKKGNEYLSVVEFAPYQRLPKKRPIRKKDLKAGTLEQDPTYISFLESLEDKSVESVHAPLEYFPPSESKKITTTPLLEFVKQRYAERQRIRDERKEERRRKDQERRRLKDDERRRRKEPLSKEAVDTSAKPAEADKENTRKRDEEKPRSTDKDKKPSENVYRQRETKTVSRSYHDGRQKVTDVRYQSRGRTSSEDPRRKMTFEGRSHIPGKTSETRRSQEFSNSKDTDQRKGSSVSRDGDHKRNEKYHGYSKDNQRFSKTYDSKKSYSQTERNYAAKSDRKQSYNVDVKQTNFDKETKGNVAAKDPTGKDSEAKDSLGGKIKNAKLDGDKDAAFDDKGKKWERTGAKPKVDGSAQALDALHDKVPVIDVPEGTEGEEHVDEPVLEEVKESEEAEESKNDGSASIEVDTGGAGDVCDNTEDRQSPEKPTKFSAKRRASLDSGDHETALHSRALEKTHTSSDWSLRRNHSLELDGTSTKGEDPGDKKDPRVERRIRNKDRPAMQIYRPGMLRRGREKGPAEQDSPSPSPSPTPTTSKGPVKSMTFKRSVSREK